MHHKNSYEIISSQGLPKLLRASNTIYRAHRMVTFAIAWLSCYTNYAFLHF